MYWTGALHFGPNGVLDAEDEAQAVGGCCLRSAQNHFPEGMPSRKPCVIQRLIISAQKLKYLGVSAG